MSSIIKIKVVRNQRYTTINLTAVEDKTLSWKAKGLHLYLLSRPDVWELRYTDLLNRSKDGKASVGLAVSELKKSGYLFVSKVS